jgi:hypothetical protein
MQNWLVTRINGKTPTGRNFTMSFMKSRCRANVRRHRSCLRLTRDEQIELSARIQRELEKLPPRFAWHSRPPRHHCGGKLVMHSWLNETVLHARQTMSIRTMPIAGFPITFEEMHGIF